jgi:hypothetical protein
MIAHKGLIKGVISKIYNNIEQEHEIVFEKNKEVDEWLMGSGESANTEFSKNSSRF